MVISPMKATPDFDVSTIVVLYLWPDTRELAPHPILKGLPTILLTSCDLFYNASNLSTIIEVIFNLILVETPNSFQTNT